MSPLFPENTTVFFSEEQVEHTKHRRKGGEDVAVFFKGSCQRGSCSSHGELHFHRWRGGHKGPRGGFGGPQGGLDDSLHRGGEGGGSGSIPARQTAGKTIGGRVLLRLNAKV